MYRLLLCIGVYCLSQVQLQLCFGLAQFHAALNECLIYSGTLCPQVLSRLLQHPLRQPPQGLARHLLSLCQPQVIPSKLTPHLLITHPTEKHMGKCCHCNSCDLLRIIKNQIQPRTVNNDLVRQKQHIWCAEMFCERCVKWKYSLCHSSWGKAQGLVHTGPAALLSWDAIVCPCSCCYSVHTGHPDCRPAVCQTSLTQESASHPGSAWWTQTGLWL